MSHRTTAPMAALTVLGGAALLLAGCSSSPAASGDDASSGGSGTETSGSVFEFQTNGIEPGEEIAIQVPDDLREAMGADADGIVIDQMVATGHTVDSAEYCAVDLAITYGASQPQALLAAGSDQSQRSDREDSLGEALGVSSVDEMVAEMADVIDEMIEQGWENDARMPQELASNVGHEIGLYYEHGDTGQAIVSRYLDGADAEETTDAVIIASSLGLPQADEAAPVAELDESAPVTGTYVSDDSATITVVGDCAASATEPDSAVEAVLPTIDADGETHTLAALHISVMTDGTIGVAGEVDGYQRDANDNWIAN